MPAIHSVMKRLGFVKLRDFGLVLTPEGRILSIRPAVLDDGLGGRIVGWKDDDLAAMELDRWSELGRAMAAKPASPPAVATPVAVRPIAPLSAIKPPPTPVRAPITTPTPQQPVAVASEPVVEEDDWEWTIAIARARAAADEVEMAAASAQRPAPRRRADTVPPPTRQFDVSDNSAPHQVLVSRAMVANETMPSIATRSAIVQETTIVEAPTPSIAKTTPVAKVTPPPLGLPTPPQPIPVVKPAPNRTFARGISPVTVIPIPKMPKAEPSKIAPVVARRTGPMAIPSIVPIPPAQPRRFAKGTGPVLPSTATAKPVEPNLSVGDKTLPSLLLPQVSRSVSR